MWNITSGNNVVDITAFDSDNNGTDELGVLKDEGGDNNFYIYDVPTTMRGATLRSYDLWNIPSGNNTMPRGLGS